MHGCNFGKLLWGAAAVFSLGGTASAQWFAGPDPCACVVPVPQTCYQTVPVTEYRQVKQVVQRPVVETEYVDQPITEYRPEIETRTAEIPTVQYQTVTEHQTVQRDCGQWLTSYECRPKISPCQYDPRPGFMGWLNRTSYSVRSTFTPSVVARRHYIPNVVTQTVPVTRQVAVPTTRQVTYNVTKMVPYETTRRVAVNKVRMVAEEITMSQPVTVMRTVPIGTAMAYATVPFGAASTATALAPSADPIGAAKAGDPSRTADARNNPLGTRRPTPVPPPVRPSAPQQFNRSSGSRSTFGSDDGAEAFDMDVKAKGASFSVPRRQTSDDEPAPGVLNFENAEASLGAAERATSVPSIVRAHRWTARTVRIEQRDAETGPVLHESTISLAGSSR